VVGLPALVADILEGYEAALRRCTVKKAQTAENNPMSDYFEGKMQALEYAIAQTKIIHREAVRLEERQPQLNIPAQTREPLTPDETK
jgi:hypothetical protein